MAMTSVVSEGSGERARAGWSRPGPPRTRQSGRFWPDGQEPLGRRPRRRADRDATVTARAAMPARVAGPSPGPGRALPRSDDPAAASGGVPTGSFAAAGVSG